MYAWGTADFTRCGENICLIKMLIRKVQPINISESDSINSIFIMRRNVSKNKLLQEPLKLVHFATQSACIHIPAILIAKSFSKNVWFNYKYHKV